MTDAPIPERHKIDYAITDPDAIVLTKFPPSHTRMLIEELAEREQLIREYTGRCRTCALLVAAKKRGNKERCDLCRRAEELLR